jgi:FHS family L-fucose permease-like MFS transporter
MNSTQKKNYALPIAMMFALFFMIAFVTNLANPFGVIVKNQFAASNFLSQLGNFANFLAYLFMGIPSGILLSKIGYKKSALLAIVIGIVGVGITYLSGQAESFAVYVFGAFISGFSMCLLNAVVNPLLNVMGKNEKQGNQLLQFGGTLNSIGATIVPILVGYLMGADESARTIAKANPALFLAIGIFIVAFLVLYLVNIPEPHLVKEKSSEKDTHGALSFNHFKMGMIAIFVYVGVEVGLSHPTNVFMTTDVSEGGLGIDPTIAGTVVGTYWFLMMCGRFLGGLVGGKMSSRTMLAGVASVGLLFVLLGIFLPVNTYVDMPVFRSNISFGLERIPINIMFFILGGLCTSVMWGSIFNLATSGLGKYTAQASGLFMMMVVGGGVLPLIQGWIADKFSFISSYWVILIGMAYILFFALVGSKNINKDIPTT